MAVVIVPAIIAGQPVVQRGVNWAAYERVLTEADDRRVPRLTYDRGELESVSPSGRHERDIVSVTLLVELVAAAHAIPVLSVGSMTYRRRAVERGFEPDASFYIRSAPLVRDEDEIDPERDPPPDLVVEVDVANSSLDKLAVFASLGVPEVWRWVEGDLSIDLLRDGSYRRVDVSAELPMLSGGMITTLMAESRSLPRPEWLRRLTDWAAAHARNELH